MVACIAHDFSGAAAALFCIAVPLAAIRSRRGAFRPLAVIAVLVRKYIGPPCALCRLAVPCMNSS